jgi:hypothetical protein
MLKSCDNLSPPITLYYKEGDRHSSSLSGLLTIISYITIIGLSIVFSLDFLLKINPTSFFYNKYLSDTGFFSLNSSGIFHFISTGEEYNISYDERAFSIYGVYENANIIEENSNMSNYNHWIYGPCTKNDIGKLKDHLSDYIESFNQGMCIQKYFDKNKNVIYDKNDINFEYPVLKHGNSNPNGNTYGIFLMRCQNHTQIGKNNCYDINKSDQFALKTFSFAIYFIDQYADVSNYNYPLTKYFNKIRNQIILESFTINNLNFKPLKIATHSGILFNEQSNINSFNLDVNEKFTIEMYNSGIYGVFYFWMGNQAGIYDRTYQKIQDICASISGISKLIMIIGYFINYLIHEITLINDLKNDIIKKTGKYGKKSSTKGLSFVNVNNYFNNQISTPMTSNKNNYFINFRNSQVNNFVNVNDSHVSKMYLKENGKKGLKLKDLSCCDIICNKLNLKNNQTINQLLHIRMKVLSEEKLITEYYIIGLISDIVLKKQNNNNFNIYNNNFNDGNINKKRTENYQKNNIFSTPQNKIFLSKESNLY